MVKRYQLDQYQTTLKKKIEKIQEKLKTISPNKRASSHDHHRSDSLDSVNSGRLSYLPV